MYVMGKSLRASMSDKPVLITTFSQLVKEARKLNKRERRTVAGMGVQGIPDGIGGPTLQSLNVDPMSAAHMAPLTTGMVNHPPAEALCYLIAALCALPKAMLYGPHGVMLKTIRQGFRAAQIRTEEGWHD